MIIRFDKSVVSDDVEQQRLLADCLVKICRDGHRIEWSGAWKGYIEKTILNTYYMGQINIDEITKNHELLNVTKQDKDFFTYIVVGSEEGMYTVGQLWILLDKASEIIVENEIYDGSVYKKWSEVYIDEPAYDDINKRVWQAFQKSRLRVHGAGGGDGTIRVIIEGLQTIFGELSTLKLTTVFDSDRKSAGNQSKNVSLISFLESNSYKYHCLLKREIENYFPQGLYENCGFVKRGKTMPTFTDEQWDFVDIPEENYLDYEKKNVKDLAKIVTKEQIKHRVAHQVKFQTRIGTVDEIQHVLLMFAKFI